MLRLWKGLLCLLGHHDWHVHRSEPRFGRNYCTRTYFTDFALAFAMAGVALFTGVVGFVGLLMVATTESYWPFIMLAILAVDAWLFSCAIRYEQRYDRACVRCGKKDLELTNRRRSLEAVKNYMDGIK